MHANALIQAHIQHAQEYGSFLLKKAFTEFPKICLLHSATSQNGFKIHSKKIDNVSVRLAISQKIYHM